MFRFGSPDYLYLLMLMPFFLLLFVLYRAKARKRLRTFADEPLLGKIIPGLAAKRPWLSFIIYITGYAFLVTALAAPQFGTRLEEVKAEGSDIVVAIDVSNSMLAEDLAPNRLERARNAVNKLIDNLRGDRIGLVVFAGKSFIQLPLTTDYSAAKLMISTLSPDLVNTQGTAIGAAIESAIEAFPEESEAGRTIIVITDGENHEDNALAAAEAAAEAGATVHTIGMGKPEGAPIPLPGSSSDFIRDEEGSTVITRLDENALRQIASEGGGSFVRVSGGTPDLAEIIRGVEEKQTQEFGTKQYTEYEDRYQYPLLIALLLFSLEPAIGNRKGALANKLSEITEKGI